MEINWRGWTADVPDTDAGDGNPARIFHQWGEAMECYAELLGARAVLADLRPELYRQRDLDPRQEAVYIQLIAPYIGIGGVDTGTWKPAWELTRFDRRLVGPADRGAGKWVEKRPYPHRVWFFTHRTPFLAPQPYRVWQPLHLPQIRERVDRLIRQVIPDAQKRIIQDISVEMMAQGIYVHAVPETGIWDADTTAASWSQPSPEA